MDPSSRLRNALVSQTQVEQRDLIQYECNLAACYEAEYLLSLKIQEEMCHQRDAYNDPSEVTCRLNTPATGTAHFTQQAAIGCSHGDGVGQFLPGFFNPSESVHPRLTAEQSAVNFHGQEQHHLSHEGADMDTDTPCSQFSRDEYQYEASEDHLMHHDGPSRKKMCLNRAEY